MRWEFKGLRARRRPSPRSLDGREIHEARTTGRSRREMGMSDYGDLGIRAERFWAVVARACGSMGARLEGESGLAASGRRPLRAARASQYSGSGRLSGRATHVACTRSVRRKSRKQPLTAGPRGQARDTTRRPNDRPARSRTPPRREDVLHT